MLEAERRRIVDRLRFAPDDPNTELRDVQVRIRDRQRDRTAAVARHERATTALDELGIVGRRLHRQQRLDLQQAVTNAEHDVARADTDLANLATVANRLTAHQPELDRLSELNHVIADRRLAASVERARTIDHEVDLAVGPYWLKSTRRVGA